MINKEKQDLILKFLDQNSFPIIPNLITHKNKFYTNFETKEDRQHIAVEIEFNLAPTTTQARNLSTLLQVKPTQSITSLQCFSISEALFKKLSDKRKSLDKMCYQPKGVHMDGNLIEFPFKPATLSAHKSMYHFYEYLIENMLNLGCTNVLGTNGLHLYIDVELFGDDPRQSVANMLRLCFENYDWLVEISKRPHIYSTNADIPTMLKDRWRTLSDTVFREAFLTTKDGFLNALDNEETIQLFNIGIHNIPNTLEIRWFATPDSGADLLAKIELVHALASFSKEQEPNSKASLEDFCKFVYDAGRLYYNCWLDLKYNSYSTDYCKKISE